MNIMRRFRFFTQNRGLGVHRLSRMGSLYLYESDYCSLGSNSWMGNFLGKDTLPPSEFDSVDFGFSILALCFKTGYGPNELTFSGILKSLFQENRIADAQEMFRKLLREAREGLCELNVSYGTMINGLCEAGHTTMALELLREMEKGGCRCGKHMYSTIIYELCKKGTLDFALDLLDGMRKKGMRPYCSTYTALICGLRDLNRWEEVIIWLKDMLNCDMHPGTTMCDEIILALCKQGLMAEAENVVNILAQANVFAGIHVIEVLMREYCVRLQVEKAREFHDSLVRRNIITIRNGICFILVEGYFTARRPDEAMRLFREMRLKGLYCSIGMYTRVIVELFRVGRCSTGLEVLDELQADHSEVLGRDAYRLMLCELLQAGQLEGTFWLLNALECKKQCHADHYSIVADKLAQAAAQPAWNISLQQDNWAARLALNLSLRQDKKIVLQRLIEQSASGIKDFNNQDLGIMLESFMHLSAVGATRKNDNN